MSMKIVGRIGERVGQIVTVDLGGSGLCFGRYLRIRVRIDKTKLLRQAVALSVSLNENSVITLLVYEKLPSMCLNRGIIGYVIRECLLLFGNILIALDTKWEH